MKKETSRTDEQRPLTKHNVGRQLKILDKETLINKIDKLVKKAGHECTMSGNIDAKRYLGFLKRWALKNF